MLLSSRSMFAHVLVTLTLGAIGCAKPPTPAKTAQEVEAAAQSAAHAMLSPDALSDDEWTVAKREDGPMLNGEPLPAGNFTIIEKSPNEVPRVILTLTDGGAQGKKFTCNLHSEITHDEFVVRPGCDGAVGSITASCVDRSLCWPYTPCPCKKDKKE